MRRVLLVTFASACFFAVPVGAAAAATTTTSAKPATTAKTVATTPATAATTVTAPAPVVTVATVAPVTVTSAAPASGTKKSAQTTVNVLIGVLLALAVVVTGISVWYWRVTKPLPAQLEPLATMSTRAWRKAPPARREASLERVRPKRPLDPLLTPVGSRPGSDDAPRHAPGQEDDGAEG